ncbi:MAG: glycerol-3-phosphate dehydrogenase/oxidase [Planctomycetes bacterium]|nr:glycerol-3-phosphate dehydrogenase/oxidase [Planctomycetota bacterium]
MRSDPRSLDRRRFDVLVVGGGIHGAALAREVALRRRSVLLVERDDFGVGTSSRSSRLIHGGLRYLEHGHLALVREALGERERLLRTAPHLVRPQPLLMPFFRDGSKSRWMVRAGLMLYDMLAGRHSLPAARSHDADACVRLFPPLRREGLKGGALFYDARTEDQRLTLAVVEAAVAAGASVANHLALERPVGDGIELRDALRDETVVVHAGLVLNASGVAVDAVRRRLGIDGPQLIRRSRGSHLVLDPLGSEVGLAAFLPDRRIQFVIPHPDGTLSGTTEVDEPADGEDEPPVPEADVTYLLDALRYLYAVPPQRAELRHAYCGLRALPAVTGPAGRLNREAFLVAEDSAVGTVHSVVGGKLTTHRAFAERVVSRLFDIRAASPSRDLPLPGGEGSQEFGDPLWWRHGSRAAAVRALAAGDPSLLEPMCPHRELLRAEAVHALRHQAAMSFTDLLARRLFHSAGPCLQPGCLAAAHALFADHLPPGVDADRDRDCAALTAWVQRTAGALCRDPAVVQTP